MMKHLLTKLPLAFLLTLSTIKTNAQGEANNWYFGVKAGITFNTNPPTALTNGELSTSEGCATMSDAAGNLLFYTDGITVYNRNHSAMPNGTGLQGNPSAAQSGVIVPKPGSATQYYVFTVPEAGAVGMRYSEVDMTLNGGFGDVIAATKNTLLFAPSSEKVTAVKHANGLYYWVIGKENGTNTTYRSYLIDCNGINTTPIISNGVIGGGNWGYLVSSPDGSKIASATSGSGVEVGDFNNQTGSISNVINLGNIDYNGYANGNYGLAFSPNSQVLYGSSITNWALVQWDLTAPSIPASQIFIAYLAGGSTTRPAYNGGALQLGPDGKIYTAEVYSPSLGVINNPNIIGTGCNYLASQINLSGRECRLGLPPFIQSFFNAGNFGFTYTNNCDGSVTQFSVIGANFLDSLHWNFDDPASGSANFSNSTSPSHQFTNTGTYQVRLIRFLDCIQDTVTLPVIVHPIITTPTSVTICPNTSYTLPSGASVQLGGTYRDTISSIHGCDSVILVTVNVINASIDAGSDTTVCIGSTLQLNATGGFTYTWDPHPSLSGTSIANPTVTPTQTTSYIVRSNVRTGSNLVVNGDFSAGATGFSTGYAYSNNNPLGGPGHYTVNTNITNGWWPSNCGDHTSGSGNMFIADGANGTNSVPAQSNAWCQTVMVAPNTDYAFSTWLANMNASGSTSSLGFFINNTQIGSNQPTPSGTCQWNEFYVVWNSGANTSASICISERSGAQPGNDFALDDISFYQICEAVDTITIHVSDPQGQFTDSLMVSCFGDTTGRATITPSGGVAPYTYSWNNGDTDSTSINLGAGTYSVTIQDSLNCSVTRNITITEPAIITDTISASICAGGTYTLGNSTFSTAGMHQTTFPAANGCDSLVVVSLYVAPPNGPGPAASIFNTGTNGAGGTIGNGAQDALWEVSANNINGSYAPAVAMSSPPGSYYNSPWADCRWISHQASGSHSGDISYYYKAEFELPCFNYCGQSYALTNIFCLNLDFFADNSVHEIYVNGVPQSANINGVPVSNPYQHTGYNSSGMVTASLCSDWQGGVNTVIIEVRSGSPYAGFLAQASISGTTQPLADTISAEICVGQTFAFGNNSYGTTGFYPHTFQNADGCDSLVVLDLLVKPNPLAPQVVHNAPLCVGDTLTMATGSVSGGTFQWTGPNSFIGNTQTVTIQNAGTQNSGNYDLTVTVNGCTSPPTTVSVMVHDIPPAPPVTSNSPVCEQGTLEIETTSGNGYSYFWEGPTGWASALMENQISNFGQQNEGNYSLYVVQNGCTSATTIHPVTLAQQLQSMASVEVHPCGQTANITLAVTPENMVQSVLWDLGDGNTADQYIFSHTYQQPGQYNATVTLTSVDGCISTETLAVLVNDIPTLDNVLLPNIITPNGDGANDNYDLDGLFAECVEYNLTIFNRWGTVIYQQQKGSVPFAGKSLMNTTISPGVYFFVIKSGNTEKNGTITVSY